MDAAAVPLTPLPLPGVTDLRVVELGVWVAAPAASGILADWGADVIPGRYVNIWFQSTKPGRYHLFCAEYCGTKHSGMSLMRPTMRT